MISDIPLLDKITVAAPCDASWEHMDSLDAHDRVRFCAGCKKNVYNLSAMTRQEAEKLVQEKEGKLCVRYFQRTDGTILTDNCPVGLRNARRRFLKFCTAAASGLGFAASGLGLFKAAKPYRTMGMIVRMPPSPPIMDGPGAVPEAPGEPFAKTPQSPTMVEPQQIEALGDPVVVSPKKDGPRRRRNGD